MTESTHNSKYIYLKASRVPAMPSPVVFSRVDPDPPPPVVAMVDNLLLDNEVVKDDEDTL